jgi:DNA repair exonuclease SbcCD ATPase subunit
MVKVKWIIHLSDLHIRTGDIEASRYNEYLSVFQNLEKSIYDEIKKKKCLAEEVIIVITGDIFHNKNKIENYGLSLYNYIISILTKITKVVIIPGNHDFRQQYIGEPSLLESLTYSSKENGVYLMNETGTLKIENVLFSHVACYDTLIPGDSRGILADLPEFPTGEWWGSDEIDWRVALFHGSFYQTKMNSRMDVQDRKNSYNFEWISDFDYALLGDIHYRQRGVIRGMDVKWGYAGSLVQQNYGEDLIDHGYIMWDLEDHTKTIAVNVYNKKGFCYMGLDKDGEWIMKKRGKTVKVSEIVKDVNFPENVMIRFQAIDESCYGVDKISFEDFVKLQNILNNAGKRDFVFADYMKSVRGKNDNDHDYDFDDSYFLNKKNDTFGKVSKFNDKKEWIPYFKEKIPEYGDLVETWIMDANSMRIDEGIAGEDGLKSISEKIKEKNKVIQKSIDAYISAEDLDITKNKIFTVTYLKWDYLLCYGSGCYFDFEKCIGKTTLVNGKNATGKSAFYEIICYALFGQTIPSRATKISSALINVRKPEGAPAKSEITIQIDGVKYTIVRHYQINSADDQKHKTIRTKSEKVYQEGIDGPIKTNKTAVDSWVKETIGGIDTFLFSSMTTQSLDNDLLSMSPKDQIDSLDKVYRITSISSLKDLIHTVFLSYRNIRDMADVLFRQMVDDKPEFDIDEFQRICDKKDALSFRIGKINKALMSETMMIDYNKYNLDILKNEKEYSYIKIQEMIEASKKSVEEYGNEYGVDISDKKALLDKEYEMKNNLKDVKSSSINDMAKKYSVGVQKRFDELGLEQCQKPLYGMEFLIEEEKILRDWIDIYKAGRFENMKFDDDCEDDIETIEKEISDIEKQLKDVYCKKPNGYDIENSEVELNEKELIGAIKKKYGSLKKLQKRFDDIGGKVVISEPKKKLGKGWGCEISMNDWDGGEEIRDTMLKKKTLEDRNLELGSSIQKLNKKISVQNSERDDIIRGERAALISEYEKSCNGRMNGDWSPVIDKKQAVEWMNDYNKKKKMEKKKRDKFSDIEKICNEYNSIDKCLTNVTDMVESLKKQISFYDEGRYECNPECPVCMKQPWVIHKKELEMEMVKKQNEVCKLEKEMKSLMGRHTSIDYYIQKKEELAEWIEGYDGMISGGEFEMYNGAIQDWGVYPVFKKKLEKIDEKIAKLEEISRETVNEVDMLLEENEKNFEEIEKLEKVLEKLTLVQEWREWMIYRDMTEYTRCIAFGEYKKWNNEVLELENVLEGMKSKLGDLVEYREYVDKWKPRVEKYIECESEYSKWVAWDKEYSGLKNIIDCHFYVDVILKSIGMIERIEYLHGLVEVKKIYEKRVDMESELERMNEEMEELGLSYIKMNNLRDDVKKYESRSGAISGFKEYVVQRMKAIEAMDKNINGFKDWLYREKILPSLVGEINKFIKNASDSSSVLTMVKCSIQDTTLGWSILNEVGGVQFEIPISKASGFQKFIVSLGARLALLNGRGGGQMFIDEGFVSCDDANLKVVPVFLNKLLRMFSSIIIVSHIDIIKDSVDVSVAICLDDVGCSSIRY